MTKSEINVLIIIVEVLMFDYYILQDLVLDPSRKNKPSDFDDNESGISCMDIEKHPNVGKCVVDTEIVEEEIPLPTATEITTILDIELRPEDVGNALQFLEFCRVFGKVCLCYH